MGIWRAPGDAGEPPPSYEKGTVLLEDSVVTRVKPLTHTSSHEAQRLSLIERRLEREWCSRLMIGFECDRGRAEGRLDLH